MYTSLKKIIGQSHSLTGRTIMKKLASCGLTGRKTKQNDTFQLFHPIYQWIMWPEFPSISITSPGICVYVSIYSPGRNFSFCFLVFYKTKAESLLILIKKLHRTSEIEKMELLSTLFFRALNPTPPSWLLFLYNLIRILFV